jgi:hypothetical protein
MGIKRYESCAFGVVEHVDGDLVLHSDYKDYVLKIARAWAADIEIHSVVMVEKNSWIKQLREMRDHAESVVRVQSQTIADHAAVMAEKDADQDRLCDVLKTSESTITQQSEKIAELRAKCEWMGAALRAVSESTHPGSKFVFPDEAIAIARTAIKETK